MTLYKTHKGERVPMTSKEESDFLAQRAADVAAREARETPPKPPTFAERIAALEADVATLKAAASARAK